MDLKTTLFRYRLLIITVLGFFVLILVSMLNEILDLPHLLFNQPATPINKTEFLLETFMLLCFGFVINVSVFIYSYRYNRSKIMLIRSLEEKEFLLKEIHHRVKNNLALITSIINLQERSVDDEKFKNILQDLKSRITSITLIHKKLYNSDDLNTAHAETYFRELLEEVTQISDKSIDIQMDFDNIRIDQKTLIPLAIVTSELVTNAIKYAFPDEAHPQIRMVLKNGKKNFLFSLGNNGAGLPQDFSIENYSSLGLTLVRLLTSQIEGDLEIVTEPHTEFRIRIPVVGE